MFKNHFMIAWRNLWKNRVSSCINIIGLSTGLLCFIVILLYVKNETGFDSFHSNPDRIYRVAKDFINADGSAIPDATTPPALSYALRRDLPEVEQATHFSPSWGRTFLIENGDRKFYETDLMRVDSSFFKVFDFAFISGNKANAFKGEQSILLTQASSKKYFGNDDPVGKTVRIDINNGKDFLVTGVLKDPPQNSHFSFDFLIPFSARSDSVFRSDWDRYGFYTYALLKPHTDPAVFRSKLQPLFNRYKPESKNRYFAQLLTDIHLRSNLKWELGNNSDMSYINILMLIGVFVIVIAGINYINLTTSRAVKRAREIGVRKVAGASKRSLIFQFIVESVCISFASFCIAILAVQLLLPFVNQLMDRQLVLFDAGQWKIWLQLAGLTLLIGVAAGLYPAFQLSSFEPAKVLKGKFSTSRSGVYLRKGLVVFQFLISITLIVSFFTIYRQVNFLMQKNLGFDKDNILVVPNANGSSIRPEGDDISMADEFRKIPAVVEVAKADGILGGQTYTNGISGRNGQNHTALNFLRVDHAFMPALGIELKEGRNFLSGLKSDSNSIIINEKAAEQLGLQKPYVGQQLEWDAILGGTVQPVTIIGVAADFHFTSLHDPIKPFGFIKQERSGSAFFIKLRSKDLSKDIAALQAVWAGHYPDKPFAYSFQDDKITRLYQADIRFRNLFSCLTVLAVIIACLGLFGLSVFVAEARNKEISIRKVLGASAGSLFALLSKDFLFLVLIAVVCASPIAWWAMHTWLGNFAYRTEISWWIFILAGFTAMCIALLTISFQAIRTAFANPAKSLRME